MVFAFFFKKAQCIPEINFPENLILGNKSYTVEGWKIGKVFRTGA